MIELVEFQQQLPISTFDTGNLCLSAGISDVEFFVFKIEDSRYRIENDPWEYPGCTSLFEIGNVVDFAYWLSNQEFPGIKPRDEWELIKVIRKAIDDYDEYLCST